jgi:hypothetical protein
VDLPGAGVDFSFPPAVMLKTDLQAREGNELIKPAAAEV